jgi:hypothetical protein
MGKRRFLDVEFVELGRVFGDHLIEMLDEPDIS